MTPRNADLHGSAPDHAPAVLLMVDVINPFDFPEADQLLAHARPMAQALATFKARLRALGIPTIYANDNFGKWRSDLSAVLTECRKPGKRGAEIAERLHPDPDDYVVLKPKHSAFFSTTLDTLLTYLGAETIILAGVAGNICVLFTANDAYLRDYRLIIPEDLMASNSRDLNDTARDQMRTVLKADIRPSTAWTDEELRELKQRA